MKQILKILQDSSAQDPTSDSYEHRVIPDNDFDEVAKAIQLWFDKREMAFANFLKEKYTPFGELWVDIKGNDFTTPELFAKFKLLNIEQEVQECDATKLNQGTEAGEQNQSTQNK